MPLVPGNDPSTISANIHELTHHGSRPRSHDQIVAIALANADRHPHRAAGGIGAPKPFHLMPQMHGATSGIGGVGSGAGHEGAHGIGIGMSPSMETPWWTRNAARQATTATRAGSFAAGGSPMSSADSPWWERQDAKIADQPFHGGYLNYGGAGRTDQLPISTGVDSHVLPADTLSGVGQDHSLAGARIMSAATGVGPMGIPLAHGMRGHGPPSPPRASGDAGKDITDPLANGGHGGTTSILAAGGEFILPPWYVRYVGEWGHRRGEQKPGESVMETGHRLIDRAILRVRKFHVDFLKSAPPPKKSTGGGV